MLGFSDKKHGLCLMMKNIINSEEFVLLHYFDNIGGSVLSLQIKRAAILGFNREPQPVTIGLDTTFSKVTVNRPGPNNLRKDHNHNKLTCYTMLSPYGLETSEIPPAIPFPPPL